MKQVSVIIPSHIQPPYLQDYVSEIADFHNVAQIVIVINGQNNTGSTVHIDTTAKSISRTDRKTIFLQHNFGFTGACNAGAKIATGEYLLFLNDDCEMSEDALQKMVVFLEKNRNVVATQSIVKKQVPSSKSQVPSTTKVNKNEILKRVQDDTRPESLNTYFPESLAVENIGFWVNTRIGKAIPETNASIFNSQFSNYKQTQGQHQKNEIPNQVPRYDRDRRDDTDKKWMLRQAQHDRSIYGLSGTCLLIRKEIFMKVGMWDESFHSYLEDVDLAIRLYKAGYKVAPCLDAEVTHEHMATSSKMGLYKEKKDVKNWWRLILKHPDVFVRPGTIFPLLLERGRNINGLFKKILRRVIQ